jgi:pimeloyl-ACP methyl ester carboxylesterase
VSSSSFVHLGKYTAELHESGSGSPVVLVPGLAGGIGLLGPLARALAPNRHVFAYQLRGENDSFNLRRPCDLDDLVDDLAELIDSLRLERPTIMGLSFGAIIALIASTVLARFPLPADSPFVNQFFNLLFGARQKKDSLFEFVTGQIWQTDQSVMAHRFRLVEDLDLQGTLHHIKAPTLVLAGERDVLVSQKNLAPLSEEIPDVSVCRLPQCGHLAFVTRPEAIARQVEQFLES